METPKNDQKIVFGVVIAIIAILLIAIVWTGRDAREFLPGSSEVDTETREVVDPEDLQNFDLIVAEEWDRYENASEDILVLGEDQEMSYSVVEDPVDGNIIYFVSNAHDDKGETQLSVYKYSQADYSFERIYRANLDLADVIASGNDAPDWATPVFELIGLDNGKLALYVVMSDYSPGPCSDVRTLKTSDYLSVLSVDLEDPYSGLDEYIIPEDIATAGQEASEACQATL